MMQTPEFSRTYRLDSLGGAPRPVDVSANPEECSALAIRFGLSSLDALAAHASLVAEGDTIEAKGHWTARGSQPCVVTGNPVVFDFDEAFRIRFIAADTPEPDAEIELTEDACDHVEHDGNGVDLGEAVSQSLGLALDPFPRSPDAESALKKAGVLSEGEAGPFGALAGLRDQLAKAQK
jgi:hypothetical protein